MVKSPCRHTDWHINPQPETTPQAISMCHDCPIIQQCAREALTAGTSLDGSYVRPANDVIQAGVVCEGDELTGVALSLIAGIPIPEYRDMKPRYQPPEMCAGCNDPMVKRRRDGAPLPNGTVAHTAQGLCTRCYKRMQSGLLDLPTVGQATANNESADALGTQIEAHKNSEGSRIHPDQGGEDPTTQGNHSHPALPAERSA